MNMSNFKVMREDPRLTVHYVNRNPAVAKRAVKSYVRYLSRGVTLDAFTLFATTGVLPVRKADKPSRLAGGPASRVDGEVREVRFNYGIYTTMIPLTKDPHVILDTRSPIYMVLNRNVLYKYSDPNHTVVSNVWCGGVPMHPLYPDAHPAGSAGNARNYISVSLHDLGTLLAATPDLTAADSMYPHNEVVMQAPVPINILRAVVINTRYRPDSDVPAGPAPDVLAGTVRAVCAASGITVPVMVSAYLPDPATL